MCGEAFARQLESVSPTEGDVVTGQAFAVLLVLIGLAAAGCLVLAARSSRWRRPALGGAVILSLAAIESCAIYLDAREVLTP